MSGAEVLVIKDEYTAESPLSLLCRHRPLASEPASNQSNGTIAFAKACAVAMPLTPAPIIQTFPRAAGFSVWLALTLAAKAGFEHTISNKLRWYSRWVFNVGIQGAARAATCALIIISFQKRGNRPTPRHSRP
jgi:hypothetical protein